MRCAAIVQSLWGDQNFDVCYSMSPPSRTDLLILSKRYDKKSLEVAISLKQKNGSKLALDLCDNHFILEGDMKHESRVAELQFAIDNVDVVFSSSEYLGELISKHSKNDLRIILIGDIIEPITPFPNRYLHPKEYLNFFKLKRRLKSNTEEPPHRFIWFGNHQGSYKDSGMVGMQLIREDLESLNNDFNFSLTIVSNSEKKFKDIFSDWNTTCFYTPWDRFFFNSVMPLHNTSLIPVVLNEFTLAKSDNRVTFSLAHGLNVIADPIPSYKKHSDKIYLGNWRESLISCLKNKRKMDEPLDITEHNRLITDKWRNSFSDIFK